MRHFNEKLNRRQLLSFFLKGSFHLFVLSIIFNFLLVLTTTLIPRLIGFTVDCVLDMNPAVNENAFIASLFGGVNFLREHYYVLPLTALLLAIIAGGSKLLTLHIGSMANEKLMQRMRNKLFFHIQRLPMSWHSQHMTGDILQRCTSDMQTILNFISTQMTSLIRIIALIALSLAFMFMMDVKLAFIAAAFIPAIFAYSLIFQLKAKKHFKKCDEEEGNLSARAQENLSAARVVKAFGREKYECEKFDAQNEYYTGLWVRLLRRLALYWSSSDFLAALQLLCIVAFGAVFAVRGSLSPGELIAFISYNTMLIGPVRELGRMISNMSKAGVSLDRIGEIINAVPEDYGKATKLLKGDVVFDDVSFGYDDALVLKGVSFTVKEGSTLGIIGGTGSGKSTIALLLDRLYSPLGGKISIGGVDISQASLSDVRNSVGLVLQNGYVYSGTIGENIGVGGQADRAEIERAAKTACLSETIADFAKGYDTVIGERGVTLSGGQKQRLLIARTLIKNSPVLVFDDSLSAVDSETDLKLRGNLAREFGDATVIMISHRITTVMNADKIIVLDKGEIVEQGTSEELIGKNGVYKRIYDRQMGEQQ